MSTITPYRLSVHGKRSMRDASVPVISLTSEDESMRLELFYENGAMHLSTKRETTVKGELVIKTTITPLNRNQRAMLIEAIEGGDVYGQIGSQHINRDGDKLTVGYAHLDVPAHAEWAAEAVALLTDARSW